MTYMDGSAAIDYEPGIDPALAEELRTAKKALLMEKKAAILYGVGMAPEKMNPRLLDYSVHVLTEVLGYDVDRVAAKIISFQNDTICNNLDADLVLAFRGVGKSTSATVTRAIWYLLRDPNIRIMLGSETEDVSIAFLDEIKGHLTENADLIAMFGDFVPAPGDTRRPWQSKRSTVRQRNKVLREATFTCLGIGSQLASRHFDVIFGDDLVTIRNSRTKTQRANLGHWHDSTLLGATMAHTRIHYVGTRYFPKDLWERLTDGRDEESTGPLADSVLRVPAIMKDPKTGKLISTCPERFSVDVLLRKRRNMGSFHFGAQYQQDTKSMEGEIFNGGDCGWYDPLLPEWRKLISESAVFLFFDLVGKKTDAGDFFSGTAIAVTPDRRAVLILDNVRFRGGMSRQRNTIFQWCKRFRPVKCGIEAVQMQAGFADEAAEISIYPIEGVPVNKDKIWNATRIQPLWEAGKILFPLVDTSPAGRRCELVMEEMTTFPNADNDDTVDSTVQAITLAMYGGPEFADAGSESNITEDPNDNADLENVFKLRAKY